MSSTRVQTRRASRPKRSRTATLSLADAAELVLGEAGGGPMHYETITDQATARRLIAPKSETPWIHMQAAIVRDIRRREGRDEAPRFAPVARGYFRLSMTRTSVEDAVESWNREVKERLRAQLSEVEPTVLETLVAALLERMGWEEVEVTPASNDGGVDVRGVLAVGGLSKIKTAVEVKRTRKNVSVELVRRLRGAINHDELGIMVATSGFSRPAQIDAEAVGRLPVSLIEGEQLVDLLAAHELGVKRRRITILDIDDQVMAGLLHDAESPSTGSGGLHGIARGEERFVLFRLPSSGGSGLDSLLMLLALAKTPVAVDQCVGALMQEFPNITRADVAIRHLRVLVALGFADIQRGDIFLMPEGRELLDNHDLALLRGALLRRIYGAEELLRALRANSIKRAEVFETLQASAALSRLSSTQAKRLTEWFVLSKLAQRSGDRLVLAAGFD